MNIKYGRLFILCMALIVLPAFGMHRVQCIMHLVHIPSKPVGVTVQECTAVTEPCEVPKSGVKTDYTRVLNITDGPIVMAQYSYDDSGFVITLYHAKSGDIEIKTKIGHIQASCTDVEYGYISRYQNYF